MEQTSLQTMPDPFFMPLPISVNGSNQVNLLNLKGMNGYVSSSSEFILPTYLDLQGQCGSTADCVLLTERNGAENDILGPVSSNSIQNLSWGIWLIDKWDVSSSTNVEPMLTFLPFITSPKTANFSTVANSLSGATYNANSTSTMTVAATNGIVDSSSLSSTVNLDFTSMQITSANIGFSVTQSGTSTDYAYSTLSPVSLASDSDVAQFTLDRTDSNGSGAGSMYFSLVDSAENNTYQHAMSGFHLQDTSTNSDFWGTAAYSQTASTPAVNTTATATVTVAVQTSANAVGVVLVTDGQDPVASGATDIGAVVETDGDVVTSSVGADTGLNVAWGRWASTNTNLVSNDPITLEQAHFMSTTNQTPNDDITSLAGTTAGTITYGLIGGSAPTDQDGNVGQYNSASMGVDFGAQQITSTQIDMTIGSDNIVLQNTGSTTINSVLSGGAISLQSSGGNVSDLTGEARAAFIGSTIPVNNINVPEGVMSSFGVTNSTGTQAVSGAVLLGNPSAQ